MLKAPYFMLNISCLIFITKRLLHHWLSLQSLRQCKVLLTSVCCAELSARTSWLSRRGPPVTHKLWPASQLTRWGRQLEKCVTVAPIVHVLSMPTTPHNTHFVQPFDSSEVSSCWVISFRILLQRWVVCIRKVLHQPAALVCLCFGRFSRKSIVLNFLRRKFQASRSVTALHLNKFRQVAIRSP